MLKEKMLKQVFTLIELLTVVAIIAIVIALLLPVLKSVRDKGKAAVCIGNLRTEYHGLQLYAADNQAYYPFVWISPNQEVTYWAALIDRYVGGKITVGLKNYLSPYTPEEERNERAKELGGYSGSKTHYCPLSLDFIIAANSQYVTYGINQPYISQKPRIGMASNVSGIMLFADSSRSTVGYGFGTIFGRWQFRHGMRLNLIYLDGHTGTVSESKLKKDLHLMMYGN